MKILTLILFLSFGMTYAQWEENFELPGTDKKTYSNRKNIYEINENEWQSTIETGKIHALIYPIKTTQFLLPYDLLTKLFSFKSENPNYQKVFSVINKISPYKSFEDVLKSLGLNTYPLEENNNFNIPKLAPEQKIHPMGMTLMKKFGTTGLTFSCASCHSSNLFGVKVLGLTNRFPRPNHFFHQLKTLRFGIPVPLIKEMTGSSENDAKLFQNDKYLLNFIGTKDPEVLGLDTSLAQVGISLSLRHQDEYASFNKAALLNPLPHPLSYKVADSKPAVWWNLKYKTRWLSDGSIVSGNPIYTNFLWNEIGRGADLKELSGWLKENQKIVKELTAAAFASEAPHYNQFFPNTINLEKAQRGEILFNKNCAGCHGYYEKNWSSPDADKLSYNELIKTNRVKYHRKTPVKDVGTDAGRYEGMKYFADDLNRLKISQEMGVKVVPQIGYVPPPLVGIWARWPYFHNNSAPTLCDVLSPVSQRPVTFYMMDSIDPKIHFDQKCNGYPRIAPENYRKPLYLYDTTKLGLSNKGHEKKILLDENGREKFSHQDKFDLIEFLKTL